MDTTDTSALAERIAELETTLRALRDREEILELAARYQRACDGGWDHPTHADPDLLASLFTEDGEYLVGEPPAASGRAAVRARFVELQAIPWIIHYLANPIVAVDGDTATAEVKGFVRLIDDHGDRLLHGAYHGHFARTAEGWRFQSWVFKSAFTPTDRAGSVEAVRY